MALNLTLWNIVTGKNTTNSLTRSELNEAISFIDRITPRYQEIVGEVEDKDTIRAGKKLIDYVHNKCSKEGVIQMSKVSSAHPKWENKQFYDALEYGMRLEKIGMVLLIRGKKSSLWLYNPKNENQIVSELERRKNLTDDDPDRELKIKDYEFKGSEFNFRKSTQKF